MHLFEATIYAAAPISLFCECCVIVMVITRYSKNVLIHLKKLVNKLKVLVLESFYILKIASEFIQT